MLKRAVLFLVCVMIMGSTAALAPRAGKPGSITDYKPVANWPQLPDHIKWGQVTAVATDSADRVYVFHRGKMPIVAFDREGKYLRSWGDGLVKNAHGLRIDRDDNVWVTDLDYHQIMKFDAQGKLLMTLGRKGEPGIGQDQFNKPADVAFGAGGEIYVADGYGNSRVVKFSPKGKYLKEWGKKGTAEGDFNLPHAICIDAKQRVYVGDRENNRIQVFDAEGKFLSQWRETGAPFGVVSQFKLRHYPFWTVLDAGRTDAPGRRPGPSCQGAGPHGQDRGSVG